MKPETRILIESYRLITRFIWQGSKLWMNHSIQKRVKWLYHRYGITRKEIIEHLKWKYKGQKKHKRHDPNLSCLKTYVLTFCYYGVLSLVREMRKHDAHLSLIPLDQYFQGEKINGRSGASYEPYEQEGIEGLVEPNNPEDILIGKELMQMALDFFGEEDLEVLLGAKDRTAEADRLGISYDAYLKRLDRKRQRFKTILIQAGYID